MDINQKDNFNQSELYEVRPTEERLFGMRVNLPNGQINADQLETIGWLSQVHAHSTGEITRQQAIRFHNIRIKDVGHVIRELSNVGLTARNAGGCARRIVEIFRDRNDRLNRTQAAAIFDQVHVRTGRQTDGLYYVGAATLRGRFSGRQMVQVAGVARLYGKSRIRLTPAQNLIILDVSAHSIEIVNAELQAVGLQISTSPSHLYKMGVTK